jgi:monoamine oxidase
MMTLGGDSRQLSALYVLRQYALLREGSLYKIAGGMDRIAAAMAGAVDTHVRYDARVLRLEPAASSVTVEYVERGRRRTVAASRVIVTVPAPVLSRIATASPELRARAALAAGIPYFPATRFLVETARRSWYDNGLSGAARTDRPAEVWETAYEVEGVSGVLGATVGGELGTALARGTRDAALRLGPDVVQQAFPSVMARRSTVYRWAVDRWAGGAFATFRPGQMTQLLPVIATPIGRVHFAGEHTAGWMGWMEGALQSADRAVEEVLA